MFRRGVAHADHHAGQMIYLCKQLCWGTMTGDGLGRVSRGLSKSLSSGPS